MMPWRVGTDSRRGDPDWAFHADDSAVFAALANGSHAGSLHFGAAAHAELAALASAGRREPRSGAQS